MRQVMEAVIEPALLFRTLDYFCYDPDTDTLRSWRRVHSHYEPVLPDVTGRLWSVELDAWLRTWDGAYLQRQARWLRLFDADGGLIPTEAEAERQRAEAAEAEPARLRDELAQRQREA